MKLVIAYFRPEQLNAVKQALYSKGIHGMSVTNIAGSGRQKGYTEQYRGVIVEVNLLKKVRLEVAVADAKVAEVMDAIAAGAQTGKEGDGMIFVQDIVDARRIRTGENGTGILG
ncbi:P-II family nitrogen regulator [Solidesulfovibrio sp.]|jgi:nitrogen regulatory protein PII|uniref:P-II family nitrogen regulator n=1 Tax=Solidesulfovibrio sp. TaxID=2910990 RepID=UPI000EC6A53D|nr:P-II family nitrogen regulator [Solidesulfovibrio sp.]MEA5090904.1 P-II family nitrogen regulator [Solidesulfovibrio sp.]HCR12697.1 transcriptional regulator [Desulfovibrio sp.]HML61390.1 P-II family nitrogen regulator [Solidesulfovibrio sp.]